MIPPFGADGSYLNNNQPIILPRSNDAPAPVYGNPYAPRGNNGGSGSGGTGTPPASSGGGAASQGSYAAANGGLDLFGTSAPYYATRLPAGANVMVSYRPDPKKYPYIYRVDLYFRDLSGGVNLPWVEIADGVFTNRIADATTDTSHSRTLGLPPLLTTDNSSANAIGALDAIASCKVEESGTIKRIVGGGDVTDKALFVATSSMTAQTYTPTSNIVSLTTVYIATGTNANPRVMVGRDSDPAQILTNFAGSPTVSGTMHANTEPMWAAVLSPLNSSTPGAGNIVMYANGSIYLLSTTAAINAAPTATLTNINDGGYGGWLLTASTDNVARAYFEEPLSDLTVSCLTSGVPTRLFSVNLEGTDKKYHDVGLPYTISACECRGGVLNTDGKQVTLWDGGVYDLSWNQGRKRISSSDGSTLVGSVQSVFSVDNRAFAVVANVNDAGNYNEITTLEEYVFEANGGQGAWYVIGQIVRAAGLLPNVSLFTHEAAVYQPYDTTTDAGNLWLYTQIDGGLVASTYEWASIPLEPNGQNPVDNQQEGARVSYKFGTRGTATTPVYHFFDGSPKVWADAKYYGDLRGAASKVTIEMALQDRTLMRFFGQALETSGAGNANTTSAVFKQTDDSKSLEWVNSDPQSSWGNRVQFKFTVDQGTSGTYVTRSSPNGLPLKLGFYVYADGEYVEPKVIEPWRFK